MKPNLLMLLVLAVGMFLAGCTGVAQEYVEADRAKFEAIAPEYRQYVEEDDDLSDEDKELRYAGLDSWEYRIRMAERQFEDDDE